jgi:putative heme-binding domain-containing protein
LAKAAHKDILAIADVSLGVPSAPAAAYLQQNIEKLSSNPGLHLRFVHHIARYGAPDATTGLLEFVKAYQPTKTRQQVALFRAIEAGTFERGAKLDDGVRAWAATLTGKMLMSANGGDLQAGAEMAGALMLDNYQDKLTKMAVDAAAPQAQRLAAITALAALDAKQNASTIGKVLGSAQASIELREQAATLLVRANQAETQEELFQALPSAPARLQNVIAAGLAGSKSGAEKLLDAIKAGKASARLLQERAVEVKLVESNLPGWKERVANLRVGLPKADEKLAALLKTRHDGFVRSKGDAALGARVFETKCAICHTIAGKGAKVGPQLDGIGIRGLDRLLEDILDPNRNVDQAFRTTILNLKDGKMVVGLLLKEEGGVYVMADSMGKEVRVPKNAVDDKTVSPSSPMPANLADQISEMDFNHLMAYLLAQTEKPEPPK